MYKSRFVSCHKSALGTVSLAGYKVSGNDSKHYAFYAVSLTIDRVRGGDSKQYAIDNAIGSETSRELGKHAYAIYNNISQL